MLLMVPLPPPVHGAGLISRQVVNSRLLKRFFQIRVLPLRFTEQPASLGRFSPIKVFHAPGISLKLVGELVFHRPDLVYVVVTPRDYSHSRDLVAWVSSECLHAVPNGLPDLPEPERERIPLKKPPMLPFLSNLKVNKGVHVCLEALRTGLPVVATREGSIPWIVSEGKSGLLCRKNDAHDLAACIERLLIKSEQCAQMGRAGRERFLERFTLERFESRLLHVIRIALKK